MFAIAEVLVNETSVNPNYHTSSDKVSTLDLTFHASAVRAILAALAELAATP
jgi:hypothetical protein